MDLVYLDYNCFQRGFDDQRQIRILMETAACQNIFNRAEQGEIELVWSFMHEDEAEICPFPVRRYETLRLAEMCKVRINPQTEIHQLANSFYERGLSSKDAVHVACAYYANSLYFLSCDDQLIRRAKQLGLDMNVMNPVDFIWREINS